MILCFCGIHEESSISSMNIRAALAPRSSDSIEIHFHFSLRLIYDSGASLWL
ncbi:hypothetical protein HMPREF1986_00018 [Oribacterium sp. oral taxon 078 str. F0263]|nr:hypothetical protein HMPREF1986_00018 [Oribacterium sp. oral taxon 078 str. F0263]